MGTASFAVTKFNQNRGSGAGTLVSSVVYTSGAFTTSTTAANLEDATGDITMSAGQILDVYADEAMRVRFGGVAATATTGHYIPASTCKQIECDEPGLVSIVDVA